jgi:ribosome-associated heat shock protein Hsp15
MTGSAPAPAAMRLDKWLWQARFFKSRTAASKLCADGRVRVDGRPVDKAHYAVRPGDVLTFPQGRAIRVVRIVALAARRGPATEARALYDDLAPDAPEDRPAPSFFAAGPRPTKAARRALERVLRSAEEAE